MAYGTLIDKTKLVSFSATATGYPTVGAAYMKTQQRLSRTGTNGSYTKGGLDYNLIPIYVLRSKVVGMIPVKTFEKRWRLVTSTRAKRVKVFYKPGRYRWKTEEITVTRRVSYRVAVVKSRPLRQRVPVVIYKRVVSEAKPYMVFGPHSLSTSTENVIDNSSVHLTGRRPNIPSWSSDLFVSGNTLSRLAESSIPIGFNQGVLGLHSVPPTMISALRRSARYKLVEKASSSSVQLVNAALEARSTKQTIFSFVKGCVSTIKAFKTGLVSSRNPRAKKRLLDAYFGWMWGLIPTINDLKDTQTALKQNAWRKASASVSDNYQAFSQPASIAFTKGFEVVDLRVTVKVGVIVQGSYGAAYLGKQVSGGGLTPTLYEALPWSFAIDWLIPLGTFLSAPDILPVQSVHSYYETIFVRGTVHTNGFVGPTERAGVVYSGGGRFREMRELSSTVRTTPAWNPELGNPFMEAQVPSIRAAGHALLLTLQRLR